MDLPAIFAFEAVIRFVFDLWEGDLIQEAEFLVRPLFEFHIPIDEKRPQLPGHPLETANVEFEMLIAVSIEGAVAEDLPIGRVESRRALLPGAAAGKGELW